MSRIIAAVPFLAWPIINPLFAMIMGKIAGIIYEELSRVVEFKMIDIQVGEQKEHYDSAVDNLKVILEKPKDVHTEQELEDAKIELKKRLHDLISLNSVK